MSTFNPGFAGVILAGGQSRRMGGGDKALLDLGGRPMLAHVIARLAAAVQPLAISANGDPAAFQAVRAAGDCGCGRRFCRSARGCAGGASVGADSRRELHRDGAVGLLPFIPFGSGRAAADAALSSASRFAVASSGGRVHPVAGLWPMDMAEVIEARARRETSEECRRSSRRPVR